MTIHSCDEVGYKKQESEARGVLSGFEMSCSEKSEPFWAQQSMTSHWEEKM